MKTAQRVRGLFLLLGAIATVWLFAGPQLDKSVAKDPSTDINPAQMEARGDLATHGGWVCESDSCKFQAVSGGSPFRSVVAQDCPFCRTTLVQQ